MKLTFEKFCEKHLPAILDIEKTTNSSPWSEESFRNEFRNAQSIFYVASLGTEMIGFGGIWKVIDEAHVTTVAVKEEHRRKGYGWEIMVRLLEEAKEQGMTCSTLEVRAGNEGAIKMYEKLGYVGVSKRKRYYPDNKEDALVMWLFSLDKWEAPSRA